MQSHVQNIHNNQKLGKIQISINLKMDKLWSNHTMKHNSVIKAKCWYMQQHGLNSHLVCWVREIRHERVPPYDLCKVQGQVKWTYSDNGCIHRCKWKGTQCLFFFNIYLFIWLHRILVATSKIFTCVMQTLTYSMWDLVPWPGFEPGPPALGAQSLSHWTSRKVPRETFKVMEIFSALYLNGGYQVYSGLLTRRQSVSWTQDLSPLCTLLMYFIFQLNF